MHIGAQKVDTDIECMSDQEYQDKYDHADDTFSGHAAHLVYNRRDNTGSKTESQKTLIRKHIA